MANKTYYGFYQSDRSITQGLHQGAVDVKSQTQDGISQWYEWLYVPFETGNPNKIPWRVIRVNVVDTSAMNVIYSAIQRNDGLDNITFPLFHTAGCEFKLNQIVYSGDFFCKTAPNGKFFPEGNAGAHVHISPRRDGMKTFINPYDVLDWYPGGSHNLGVVKGKDNYIPTPLPPDPIDYKAKYDQLHNALVGYAAVVQSNRKTEDDLLAKMTSI